jgi:hypothetical protein
VAGIVVTWLETNWFALLQTVGIVAGLFFTGYAASRDNRSRRIENLLSIHDSHRTIWLQIFDDPQLLRILKPNARLATKPVTLEERIFVNLIILHLTGVLAAMRLKVMEKPAGLDSDLREFFALPIPAEVWRQTLQYRDQPTRKYVESLSEDLMESDSRRRHSRIRCKAGLSWPKWGARKSWRIW